MVWSPLMWRFMVWSPLMWRFFHVENTLHLLLFKHYQCYCYCSCNPWKKLSLKEFYPVVLSSTDPNPTCFSWLFDFRSVLVWTLHQQRQCFPQQPQAIGSHYQCRLMLGRVVAFFHRSKPDIIVGDPIRAELLAHDLDGESPQTTSSFSAEKKPCFLSIVNGTKK